MKFARRYNYIEKAHNNLKWPFVRDLVKYTYVKIFKRIL